MALQTLHISTLKSEFEFAGFTFPRYIAALPRGSKATRIRSRKPAVAGQYIVSPHPARGNDRWYSFYLDAEFSLRRWQWCDEVDGDSISRINHTGWNTDEHGDGDTIRGIVIQLPRGKFLAGWSMGEEMISAVEVRTLDDIDEAARTADQLAEYQAMREREYRETEDGEQG